MYAQIRYTATYAANVTYHGNYSSGGRYDSESFFLMMWRMMLKVAVLSSLRLRQELASRILEFGYQTRLRG